MTAAVPLNVKDARFVVRPDEKDPSFARWAIEFDGEDYVVGTRPAPRDEIYEFIEWMRTNLADLEVSPPPDAEDA